MLARTWVRACSQLVALPMGDALFVESDTAHAHDGWRANIGGLVVHACDFFGCSTLAWQHILSVCVGRVRETGCGGRVRVVSFSEIV